MAAEDDPDRWARLRFAIIGPLLAAPPPSGELRKTLVALARQNWKHPVNGTAIRFSVPTLERWFYAARKARDPVAALRREVREDAGRFRALSAAVIQALEAQYHQHSGWTVHYAPTLIMLRRCPYRLSSNAPNRRLTAHNVRLLRKQLRGNGANSSNSRLLARRAWM